MSIVHATMQGSYWIDLAFSGIVMEVSDGQRDAARGRTTQSLLPRPNIGSTHWLFPYLLLSVIWGSSFALIKTAVEAGVAPVWVAFARCFFGAIVLVCIGFVARMRWPRELRTWGHAMVVALLLNSVPFTLLAFGESRVDSVVAGILNAAVPLTTFVFVVAFVPQERLSANKVAGVFIGLCGVAVTLGVWRGLSGSLIGGAACFASAISLGAGFGYARRYYTSGKGSIIELATIQLLCATAQLAIVSPIIGPSLSWPGWTSFIALVVLGSVCTGLAYILNLQVLRSAGATIASSVTYVIPIWSILIGAVFLAEKLLWNAAVGAVIVLAGVLISSRRRRVRLTRKPEASHTDCVGTRILHGAEERNDVR